MIIWVPHRRETVEERGGNRPREKKDRKMLPNDTSEAFLFRVIAE
jgi:hypothetical protein